MPTEMFEICHAYNLKLICTATVSMEGVCSLFLGVQQVHRFVCLFVLFFLFIFRGGLAHSVGGFLRGKQQV